MKTSIYIIILAVLGGGYFFYQQNNQFELPKGDTTVLSDNNPKLLKGDEKNKTKVMKKSTRKISVTDGVKHSIPLNEILAGGPPKDGIPSIDNPNFISIKEADSFLKDDSVGLGLDLNGEARFYPYQILVWHEIVNDRVGGTPVLISYCPLCATGIVFDPIIDGKAVEFGTSGKLWQSNLLMYNRSSDESKESLWSQILGEAVLGEFTGYKLKVIPSDTVLYGGWKKKHPQTKILSKETGSLRSYGLDPYGDYYTDQTVGFGASFNDSRLHPKTFVLGVEIDGKFKAYSREALKIGETVDSFSGKEVKITKDDIGKVTMFIGKDSLPYVGGFWFAWLAVHPDTELFK